MLLRRAARPLLAGYFIWDGVSALRDPKPHETAARPVLEQLDRVAPVTEEVGEATLVRAHAWVKIGAGSLLACGVAPRLCAAALAAGVIPTTLAHHRFWEQQAPDRRSREQTEFVKDLALLGGLLVTSADTAGKPSLAWRMRRGRRSRTAGHSAAALTDALDRAGNAADRAGHAASHAADRAGHAAELALDRTGHAAELVAERAGHAADRTVEVAADQTARAARLAGRVSGELLERANRAGTTLAEAAGDAGTRSKKARRRKARKYATLRLF
jgi:uncharacterized membrane protein YphA (DoxX/SURF4 family)